MPAPQTFADRSRVLPFRQPQVAGSPAPGAPGQLIAFPGCGHLPHGVRQHSLRRGWQSLKQRWLRGLSPINASAGHHAWEPFG